jgi:hypothetical protein
MSSLEETVKTVEALEGLWRSVEKDQVLRALGDQSCHLIAFRLQKFDKLRDQSCYLIAFRLGKFHVLLGLWRSGETPPLPLSQFVGIVDPTQKIQAQRLVLSFQASEAGPFDLGGLASKVRKRRKDVDAVLTEALQRKREEALRAPDAFLNDMRDCEEEASWEAPVERFPSSRAVSGGLPSLGKRR